MVDVPCFVGIDVAKAPWDIALRPCGERWAVPNDAGGVVTLVERLQALHPTLIVLEVTGGPERAATAALATAGPSSSSTRGRRVILRAPPGSEPRRMRWRRAPWPTVPTGFVRRPARCRTPRRRSCALCWGVARN
jgi:hypothetical protein